MNRAHVRLNFARAHDYVRRRIFRYTSEFPRVGRSRLTRWEYNEPRVARRGSYVSYLRQLLTISVSFLFDLEARWLMPRGTRYRDRIQN